MTDAQLTYKVELDVSGSAFGTTFAATDVTSKAVAGTPFQPITVTWGRQDQHSDVTPTTVDGALLNTDGTFTPGNTSGTYYPNIRRNLRRRVSVGVNSTTVHLSEDYAASLEVVPAKDVPAITAISGSDILARFGQSSSTQDVNAQTVGTTLRSFLAEEMVLTSNLICLYLLQESEGATSFGDMTGSHPPLTVVNSKYGAGEVLAGQTASGTFLAGTVVEITNANYGTTTLGGSWLAGSLPGNTTPVTLEAWVQTPSSAPASVNAQIIRLVSSSTSQGLEINTAGQLVYDGLTSPASVCDGNIHHFVVTNNVGTEKLYIDGVNVATGSGSPMPTATSITIGMRADGVGGRQPLTGAIAYFGLYDTAHDAATVTAHYNAGNNEFQGERTDQRITRLLSYRANTGSSLDTGLGTVGPQEIQGRSLQDCLFEVGQVEAGAVFTDGLGQVNFRSRSRLFNPTPTVTLDMSVGGVDFGSNWREDTQNAMNDATVTNSTTGSAQRFFDSTSITNDGEYATSVDLPLNSDADALNMAGWLVINGTQAQLTATPLIVDLLHITAAQAQAVLQLKPLDCLRLTNCPTPTPSATQTFIVEGGSISLAAEAASVTLNLTPLPYPVAVWDSTNWDATGVTWAF